MPDIIRRVIRELPPDWQLPVRFQLRRMLGRLEPEMMWFLSHIPKGERVVDVGGNVGSYTIAATDSGHYVEVFEPLPDCAELLAAYAATHPSVRLHRTALGEAEGTATLSVPVRQGERRTGRASFLGDLLGPDPQEHFQVPVRRLDAMGLPHVGGIKIDVEGFELPVLRGARDLIARDHPVLLVEIDQQFHGGTITHVVSEVCAMGYNALFLNDKIQPTPYGRYDLRYHQVGPDKRAPAGRMANTFLFLPGG